ncbi:DUF2213 domain-containing protein [Heyndrickxia faecalis]|uniref:DUF2213 domain-containing protein n=1 Tax=Heyndrickxia faecalis TaxID=2824910 RepID=UPI003D24CC9F
MKLQRYDKAFIQDFRETPEGYLTVNAPITRPGVFPYMRADGSLKMEAKLPEELFSSATVQSAQAKPVTDDHPNEPVTAANFKQYAKGMTHTDAAIKDNKLWVSFTITDAALIQKIKSGKRELSIGFLSDVRDEPGEYAGQRYDSVQRNIEINHLAVVDKGRAGPEVAIRGDSAAFMIGSDEGGEKMKYKIDGVEYEVDAAVKQFIEAQAARLDAAQAKAKEYDTLQGKYDALDAQLKKKEKELEEAKKNTLSADELDKKVNERMELITGASTLLGDSFDFTGKTDREIKEAVIQKVKPDFKGDGKSDDYINAFYDATVEGAKRDGFSSTGANQMQMLSGDAKTSIEQKRQQRMNMKNMNKGQ